MEGDANPPLATPDEVAEYLGVKVQHLAQMRWLGKGPRFIKLSERRVRYRWADVDAYLAANTLSRTDQAPPAA